MKKILLYLSIFVLLISCANNPTEKQLTFSKKLLSTPGITHTEWGNTLTLWVKVNPDSLGLNAKPKAQELANKIASAGVRETQQNICVVIYFASYKEIASSCINF